MSAQAVMNGKLIAQACNLLVPGAGTSDLSTL